MSHYDTRRATIAPASSLVVVQVRQLLAVNCPPASVTNVLHRFDWVLKNVTKRENGNIEGKSVQQQSAAILLYSHSHES